MMDRLRRRGDEIAAERLVRVRSAVRTALGALSPDDVRLTETAEGVVVEARRLRERLAEDSSLRDVGLLMRDVL